MPVLPALFVLSFFSTTAIVWLRGGHRSVVLLSKYGLLSVVIAPGSVTAGTPPAFNVHWLGPYPDEAQFYETSFDSQPTAEHHLLGFGYVESTLTDYGKAEKVRAVAVPYWFLCLAPTVAIVRRIRWAAVSSDRRSRGRCLACGYDLRASTGRCPECGTLIEAANDL